MNPGNVFRDVAPLTESEFRRLAAAGIANLAALDGHDQVALRIGCCGKTISNAVASKGTIRADLLLNGVLAGPGAFSALWERVQWEPASRAVAQQPDIHVLADLSGLLAQYADAMRDGRRCHRETLALAVRIRTLAPALNHILADADRLTGG